MRSHYRGLILGVAATAALAVAAAAEKGKDVVWPAEKIAWAAGPAPGTKVATLWGDMNKGGPYGVLIQFDAGITHPLHWHSKDLKVVVLSGTFVHQPEGGAETRLGPGSYLMQAAKGRHVSGCAAGSECRFVMISGGKFDLKPVETKKP